MIVIIYFTQCSIVVQWSSGYDFCLTHRRSPVRPRVEPLFSNSVSGKQFIVLKINLECSYQEHVESLYCNMSNSYVNLNYWLFLTTFHPKLINYITIIWSAAVRRPTIDPEEQASDSDSVIQIQMQVLVMISVLLIFLSLSLVLRV